MVIIKILDYFADSLDVPEVSSDVSEITLTTDFGIKINNYSDIINYDDNEFVIKLKKDIMTVYGNNLNITYINDKYIVLNGIITGVDFKGCD